MADRNETTPAEVAAEQTSDRRDSRRVPVQLLVRDLGTGGSFEPADGNLSLGGVYYEGLHPPVGSRLEIRFLLPGFEGEIRATGEVLRVSRDGARFGAHIRFAEIPIEAELAVARFLQKEER